MKTIISDIDILSNLEPQKMEAYLQAKGWHERNRIPDKVSIWTRDNFSEDQLKIQLPVDQYFDDYPRRMYEIMEILENAERRSQLEIISELITTANNITIPGFVRKINTSNANQLSGNIVIFV
jgi:hypothetical protein